MIGSTWLVDPMKIPSRRELGIVLDDLSRRAPRLLSVWLNRVNCRLARCPSLRIAGELATAKYTASTMSKSFVREVASPALTRELSFGAAVDCTDCSAEELLFDRARQTLCQGAH